MRKVADRYPITTIKYPTGDTSVELILDNHLKEYTKPAEWSRLVEFLSGQTRALEGSYADDVERWLNRLPNND